ncbi:MAG TPA: matrixin family metalloprotease [Blastocatellia bacterium]|nr:matrixin family metalloprotease [Blastocatellia bacterium]
MLTRRPLFLLLFASLCLTLHSRAALATTVIIPSDADMVIGARAIVTGKVREVSTALDVESGVVFTYVRLRVREVLKGEIYDREIVLKQPGGEAEGRGTSIYGMPRFAAGQKVLLYLDTWPDGSLRVHQWFLGKFNITKDPATGQEMVTREDAGQNVHILASEVGSTSGGALQSYRELIGRLMEAKAGEAQEFENKYYLGVPLLARPPEFAQLRRSGGIVPQYTFMNQPNPARWFEPDSGQPVLFFINTEQAPYEQITEDIVAAMNVWSAATGNLLRIVNGGATTGCGVTKTDGENTISFNNCDGYFSPSSGCSGVLAVGGIITYTTSHKQTVGGVTFYQALEGNVSFNPYAACSFASRCAVQEITTHELGHALGIGHSSDSGATMYQYLHDDGRCASLGSDDKAAIKAMYPGGPTGSGLNITTGAQLPNATLGAAYSVRLEATGGSGGYTWSLLSGQLPPGLQMTADGTVQGTPSAFGSFSFTAQVRDSAGNLSQKVFLLSVEQVPGPVITNLLYKKKKLTISGTNIDPAATVYLDGQRVAASPDGDSLKTKKVKLKRGAHTLYVVNPDGRESNVVSFTLT